MALKSNQFVGNVSNFLIPDEAQDQLVGNVSNFLIPDGAQEQSVSCKRFQFLDSRWRSRAMETFPRRDFFDILY